MDQFKTGCNPRRCEKPLFAPNNLLRDLGDLPLNRVGKSGFLRLYTLKLRQPGGVLQPRK